MRNMNNEELTKRLSNIERLLETNIQQRSGHHSDLLKRIIDLDNKLDIKYQTIIDWQIQHEKDDNKRFDEIPTKSNMEETLNNILIGKGGKIKGYIITTAIVMGALTGIVASLKVFLGWIGINLIRQ